MRVFGGSSNQPLAKKLAVELGVEWGEVELSRFANDEARVWVKAKPVPREVVVVQSLNAPTDHHLIEFCLLCDALKRQGAKEITAVIPYLGYSKQDKVFRPGEPLSVKVIAKIIQTISLERMITLDLHNLAILGFFEIPVENLSASQLFVDQFRADLGQRALVVAPDAGAIKASTALAQELGLEVAYIDKKRDLVTGKVSIAGISRPVVGAEVVMVDDMVATGETLIVTAKFLKEQGAAKVKVGATHHLYVPQAQERLEESAVDELWVTDSIRPQAEGGKLKVLSTVKLLAHALKL